MKTKRIYAVALSTMMMISMPQIAAAEATTETTESVFAAFMDEDTEAVTGVLSDEETAEEAAEEPKEEVQRKEIAPQGKITDDISYEWDAETGTLSFTGSGDARFALKGDEVLGEGYAKEEAEALKGDLRKVVIGEGITSIDCKALSFFAEAEVGYDLVITAPIRKIEDLSFAGADIRSLVLPDTLEEIGYLTFTDASIKTLSLPDGVRRIGALAFGRCEALTDIELPSSIEEIHKLAFAKCDDLTEVYYRGTWQEYHAKDLYGSSFIQMLPKSFDMADLSNMPIRFAKLMPDEKKADQWLRKGTEWYGLRNGEALSGVVEDGGKLYYLDDNGKMLTGWQKIDGKWHYFKKGAMSFGWQKISGKWYYFLPSTGVMANNCTKEIDGKTYAFRKNGSLGINGWVEITVDPAEYVIDGEDADDTPGGLWFYTNAQGEIMTDTVINYGGEEYQLGDRGFWYDTDNVGAVITKKY